MASQAEEAAEAVAAPETAPEGAVAAAPEAVAEKEPEKAPVAEKEPEPDDFVAFWDVYPRKVNKVGALKAWRARLREKSATPGALITSAQNYATKVAGKDPEYIIHPSTFLGPQQRWKDFPAAAHPASRVVHKFCGSCGKEYWGSACDCGWSE